MTPAEQILRDELTLTPERTARMLRMTALVTLVVALSMALRVPEAAVSAYMVFFVAKSDAATTVKVGIALVAGVTVALALVFVFFSVVLADPALRLPLMALLIFGGMYFMRTSPVGALGLAIGFITSYSLTYVDQVPSPEALVRGLLWLWVVIAYPIALVVLADLAFGRRPEEVYRQGVAARLHAAGAALCAPVESGLVVDEAAGWLSALSASTAAQRPIPALAPVEPAVAAFDRALDGSADSPGLRARLRLHVEWLELLRTQVAQLADRAPA